MRPVSVATLSWDGDLFSPLPLTGGETGVGTRLGSAMERRGSAPTLIEDAHRGLL
ncbi:MAG: hypothetical protein R3B96_14755 [Pirellulaceae bacterium]